MKRIITALALGLVLTACGGGEPAGHPDVVQALAGTDDCDLLQGYFNVAYARHERESDPAEAQRYTADMDAAMERMKAVGC
jgi:hypothetical protein